MAVTLSRRGFLQSAAPGLAAADFASAAPGGDPASLTLEAAAAAVRARRISAVELTAACLQRIEKLNPILNAFITVTGEQALEQARELDDEARRGRRRSPIHGVPIALKDLIDTAGIRTTAASALFADRVPSEDAEVVRRLKAAGAVLVGKTNMDEFAYNFTSETSRFGPVKNPWKPERIPGGSSGGSAAAVSARMCFGALGSDTGGSIRLPAALCGIAGLKPSYGLVSARGVLPLAWSMDHVGPMCRTAADTALLLGTMVGYDPADPGSAQAPAADYAAAVKQPVRGFRIGIARKPFFESLDAEIESAVNAAIETARGLTREARDVTLPELPPSPVIRAEALAYHEPMLKESASRYHPHTLHEIREGEKVTLGDYVRGLRELRRARREIGRVFEQVDIVLTPVSPRSPFALGKVETPDLIYLRNTIPFNVYGIPAMSIPCGFTRDGAPIGLQLAGPLFGEEKLFAFAGAFERATEWSNRVPPG
ncbi:MAG: amidase [Bryobacteraceae bacterium]|nr:amidase [Bryobacteraceae bacterium]